MCRQDVPHRDRPQGAAWVLGVDADEHKRCEDEMGAAGKVQEVERATEGQAAPLHLG